MANALQAGPAIRAVRNILANLVIQPESFYNVPVHAFGDVGIGRRQAANNRLVASVLYQSNDTRQPTLGQYQWDFTIVVELFYRVSQDAETAELTLADAYPAAMHAFYENRTLVDPDTQLPTVQSSQVSGPASNPWYEPLAAQEYRVQVMFLNCSLRNTFNSSQPVYS